MDMMADYQVGTFRGDATASTYDREVGVRVSLAAGGRVATMGAPGAGKNGPGKKGPGKKGPVKTVPVKTVLGKNGPGKKGPSDYLDS